MSLPSILLSNFAVLVPGLHVGRQYRVDFYANLNMNGGYDLPPTDHAWREVFTNTTGNVALNFTHNGNFTDIEWPYLDVDSRQQANQPDRFALAQNYPNPFYPTTTIAYDLSNEGYVTLTV